MFRQGFIPARPTVDHAETRTGRVPAPPQVSRVVCSSPSKGSKAGSLGWECRLQRIDLIVPDQHVVRRLVRTVQLLPFRRKLRRVCQPHPVDSSRTLCGVKPQRVRQGLCDSQDNLRDGLQRSALAGATAGTRVAAARRYPHSCTLHSRISTGTAAAALCTVQSAVSYPLAEQTTTTSLDTSQQHHQLQHHQLLRLAILNAFSQRLLLSTKITLIIPLRRADRLLPAFFLGNYS